MKHYFRESYKFLWLEEDEQRIGTEGAHISTGSYDEVKSILLNSIRIEDEPEIVLEIKGVFLMVKTKTDDGCKLTTIEKITSNE